MSIKVKAERHKLYYTMHRTIDYAPYSYTNVSLIRTQIDNNPILASIRCNKQLFTITENYYSFKLYNLITSLNAARVQTRAGK